jgi:LAO/AO transport system kinase
MRDIARLVTLVERDDDAAVAERAGPLAAMEGDELAPIVGVTGAPGVGKSTLVGALARDLAGDRRLAVLAIDPSSPHSGGALLGDRLRIGAPADRVFVRSQASGGVRGGLAPRTYPVLRVLRRLFDLVLVETVGVGQSEDDVRHVADDLLLCVQPLAGDHVQHLKAGLMEAPDAIVVTKCDEERLAAAAVGEVRATIGLARPGAAIDVYAVSARSGAGVAELAARLRTGTPVGPERERDDWFIRTAVRERYGRLGIERIEVAGLPAAASLDERLARALATASSPI